MITSKCESFKTSLIDGKLFRPEMYAHNPSSVNPDPPTVIGKLPNSVEAAVAKIDSYSPRSDSMRLPSTRKDAPRQANAKNVRIIPTKNILIVLLELKFSLLIVHNSLIAEFI